MSDTPQAARRYLARIGKKGGSVKGKRNATQTGKQAAAKRWSLEKRNAELIRAGDMLAHSHRVSVAKDYVVAALDAWSMAREAKP